MEEKCYECNRIFNEYSVTSTCLKCHTVACLYCEDKHTRNNVGHVYILPPLNIYSTRCPSHFLPYNKLCQHCDVFICDTCLMTRHKEHKTRPVLEITNEIKGEVAAEIRKIEKSSEKVKCQLVERERNLNAIIQEAKTIDLNLDLELRRINALLLEKRQYLEQIIKCQPHEDLRVLLSEIRSLNLWISIDTVLGKTLKGLLEKTYNHSDPSILTGYAEFRKYAETLVTYPKAVDDEFLPMAIDYQKSTDEEIKKVLPRICIGRTRDITCRKGEKDETSKIDSTQTQKDTREKDELITDLQDKLRSSCKVIEEISEHVIRLADVSSSMDGQCSTSLEPQRNLPTHLNMDAKIENIHLSMENIKRNIEKKNMLLKTSDALIKEQEKRIRSDELKDVPRTDVRNLKIQISLLENRLMTSDAQAKEQEEYIRRLKTSDAQAKEQEEYIRRLKMSDAQAKEQEEYIRREQLEKSAVEIQKWKQKVVEIQDRLKTSDAQAKEQEEYIRRLKTSDAQAKEQEEYIRREQLEKSAVEIQKWKQKVVEIQDRLKTSDAQAKEQEEYIRREQLAKSAVEIQKLKQNVVEIQKRYEAICNQHETKKRELKRSEEEKDNLMTRLSQVAGAKLTAGNTSIAELGDKYRPTRISDMFAEMYDSDWTDVMNDILESHKEWTEELVVRHIFIVLQECFHDCKRIATEQMKRLCEDMFLSASTQDLSNYVETHVTEIKQLQDARKRTAPFVGKMLTERVFGSSTFGLNCRRNKGINMPLVSQITASKFGQQCVNICWFMVVQDPEMYIDGGLQPGIQFDREDYKEYTRSGKRVAFSVWPALYLHKDGPLLTKGVAQPCD